MRLLPGTLRLPIAVTLLLLGGCQLHQDDNSNIPVSATVSDNRLWISDLGNGEYRNPILHIDYSDPDVVAVDGNYYMTASSFNAAPGLPILHSTDLVNWTLINYALPRQVPESVFATPQHGNGVWAPNIRYHDNKYWIFYPDPDHGIYVTTAKDPTDKWSKPRLILSGKGIIDPTPLWDDDGKAYLLHAWAKSRAGFNNVLSLRKMSPDATNVSDTYTHIVDGNVLDGYRTIEGPKFYKRDGKYYIFAPAGGVETGWQSVFRADNVRGPYEVRKVMAQGSSMINGPHQGSWIHTNQNEDWFIHFQSRKAYGRIVHLQPLTWSDGWPVIGSDDNNDGVGEPVYRYAKPLTTAPGKIVPQPTSDEFNNNTLSIQWQWNANPQKEWHVFNNNHLRLYGQPKVKKTGDNLWMTPSLLLQKLPAQSFEVRTKVNMTTSQKPEGGLLLFGEDYAWIGIKQINGEPHIVYVQCSSARTGCDESVDDYGTVDAKFLELRYMLADDATAIFSYRTSASDTFTVIGEQFKARRGRWVGAKTGLFSLSNDADSASFVDFDYVRYTPKLRKMP